MGARYRFTLAGLTGIRSYELGSYLSASYVLAENEITPLVITLPSSEYDPNLFSNPDGRIYVERAAADNLPLHLEGETAWLIRKLDEYEDDNNVSLTELLAYNANYILEGAVIPYATGATGVPGSIKLTYGDDIIKAIVRENLGSLASDTTRNLSDVLTIDADTSSAPIMLREFSYRNVFEAITEIAAACAEGGVWLGFNVVTNPVNGNLTFRTYPNFIGTDRTNGLLRHVISQENGNLTKGRYSEDWSDAKTSIYAIGQSVANIRPTINVKDTNAVGLSPFNRRELIVTTNAPNSDALTEEANSALFSNRAKRVLTGELLQTQDSIYGYHYFWGDVLAASFHQRFFSARVSRVHVTIQDKVDQVNIGIRSDE